MIKFVNDVQQVGGFFSGTPVSPINITDRKDITSILLKVALYTINLNQFYALVTYRYYNNNISYSATFY